MASAKLTCPECQTVLRPNKPVAAGKKVKCPKCETVFTAPDEEEVEEVEELDELEEARPRKVAAGKKSAPAKPAKKEEKPAAKKEEDEEDAGTYGYVKEAEETAEEKKKKKVRHGPDTSVKDPRGPATVKLAGPTGKLQLVGSLGALGWLILTLLIIFPAVFPISEKDKEIMKNVPEAPDPGAKKEKPKPKTPPFWTVYGIDVDKNIIELKWYTFMAAMVPFLLMACYCALIVSGGIKAQNLESRTWGIVASSMALLPLTTAGLGLIFSLLLQWLSFQVLDEQELGIYVGIGVNALLWLTSAGIGGWTLKTLMDEEVQEGFVYEPE